MLEIDDKSWQATKKIKERGHFPWLSSVKTTKNDVDDKQRIGDTKVGLPPINGSFILHELSIFECSSSK